MERTFLLALGALTLMVGWHDSSPPAAGQVPDSPPPSGSPMVPGARRGADARFGDFNTVVKDAKVYEGLFKLYQKDEHVYMEIPPNHMNKPVLCPIAIARGLGMGGETLNFDEQWVLLFKRVGDKVHLIRRNVHFKAKAGSPVARAVEITYADSVLMALRIAALNPANQQAPLISLNDIFITDFAQLGLGGFDA